ncbi:MAG: FAD-binding oxidoreductase [Planctomycetes bacterium]|nr:FAD-binding oxidoreductase [Planctomycetota bacterium]
MEYSLDIAVVGGGVIGLTAAYYLSREGLRVGVFDKQDLGKEASWAGAGILPTGNLQKAQAPLDRLRALSAEQFPQLSEELRERTGVDNGYLRCGGLEFIDRAASDTAEEWRG